MDDTGLYYFFSTVAQVLAAVSALLAVFSQFKIKEISDFLVGDGQSIFDRIESKEEGYNPPTPNTYGRIRDAVARRSIPDINEIIQQYALSQNEQSKTRGFTYLQKSFERRVQQIKDIKRMTRWSVLMAFIGIFTSLLFIATVKQMECCYYWPVGIIMLLVLIFLCMSFWGVYLGMKDQEGV